MLTFYIDGAVAGTGSTTGYDTGVLGRVDIGAAASTMVVHDHMDDSVAAIEIYSRALTQAEIAETMTYSHPREIMPWTK